MAIYDVDSIMESEYEDSTNNVLDNMLEACDQMLTALDESKARRRVVEVLKNKKNQYDKNAEAYGELRDAAHKVGNRKLTNKYSEKRSENLSKSRGIDDKLSRIDTDRYKDDIAYKKIAEEKFKDLYNATPAKERKPGFYKNLYDKKKAIKETCLNILSVIDEL